MGGAAVAMGLGCSRGPELEPADSAATVGVGDDTAFAVAQGVRVFAQGDSWSGDSEVREHVTPVEVKIQNTGSEPVRVRYPQMSLVSADGQTFRAVPPFDVRGTVQKTVDQLVPRFGYRDIEVAPYLGSVYRGSEVELEPPATFMDYPYYDHLYDYWKATIPLPTQHMQEVALPEATVRPGGNVDGFVYFERVPETVRQVTLNVEIANADSGEPMGTASIPFEVDD